MANRYDYAQAQHNIKQLQAALGLENYNAWHAQAVSESDSWMTIDLKVQDMLACIALSDDEADQRQTLNDARGF